MHITSMHIKVAARIVVWLSIFSFLTTRDSRSFAAESIAGSFNEEDIARAAIEQADKGWWAESMRTKDQRIDWWREARFGCFMHWGVYSTLAGEWQGKPVTGYSEHIQRKMKIDQATYRREAVEKFNPTAFNADEWAALLKKAGMRYLIITSKHHDGFAMFDSDVSDYNVVDATPFRRDPMRELADACRRQGIKFGFYYSQAFDWGEADGAGNDWEFKNPGGDRLIGSKNWWESIPEEFPRIQEKYVNAKAIPQLKELISKYDPDILWFDTSGKLPFSENLRILQAIREVDVDVVVNGRLARGHSRNFGDYINTGDRAEELSQVGGDWEAIPTTNESYGYHRHDHSHKPPQYFIRLLAKAISRNGNMLLNVGPMADGRIDPKDVRILEAIGSWLHTNGESIYGCGLTPLAIQPWGTSTRKDNTLYLQVFDWPADGELIVGGLKSDPTSAELLEIDGRAKLEFERRGDKDLIIRLPEKAPFPDDSVIKLRFAGDIDCDPVRLLTTSGTMNRLLTFDAERSRGIGVGDGKRDRYFVTGMNGPRRRLAWKVRLNEPATFDVAIRYAAGDPSAEGHYVVECGDQKLTQSVSQPERDEPVRKESVGKLTLSPGENTITLRTPDAHGRELFRPLELILQPQVK
jgi:alpha-L-fucosidase